MALVAAVVYTLVYAGVQQYYGREVSTQEIAIGGIVFFLAFAAAHTVVTRFRLRK